MENKLDYEYVIKNIPEQNGVAEYKMSISSKWGITPPFFYVEPHGEFDQNHKVMKQYQKQKEQQINSQSLYEKIVSKTC